VTAWHDVGSLEQLERDGHLLARIGGREIGVIKAADRLRAVRNRCPHRGGPLCFGRVRERLSGAPGRYALEGRTVLSCPWHGWEFDLETGRCPDDSAMRVAVYRVQAKDDRVLVEA
jgi:nitrite reductase (NADH) small subunit